MHKDLKTILGAFGIFLLLSLFSGLPVLLLYLDASWLDNSMGEASLIEISQSLVLVLCIASFVVVAKNERAERGFAILAVAFFLCMLIREQNNMLNDVMENLWKWLVYTCAIIGVFLAALQGSKTVSALARFLGTRAGSVMMVGLVLLLAYSRLFGMEVLWRAIMDDSYIRIVKNAAEEGTELMAYLVILAASQGYCCQFQSFWGQKRTLSPAGVDHLH